MTCATPNIYVGTTQSFFYGANPNQLSLTLVRKNFKPGEGEGGLKRLGYDRVENTQHLRTVDYSNLGIAYWRGPSYEPLMTFRWNLQQLTDAQFWALDGMMKRQNKDQGAIRLLDYRWAMQEANPRTRARLGPVLINAGGRIAFFAQFNIELSFSEPPDYNPGGLHSCRLEAKEIDKVPVTEDIP